jgi:hypothetical protein
MLAIGVLVKLVETLNTQLEALDSVSYAQVASFALRYPRGQFAPKEARRMWVPIIPSTRAPVSLGLAAHDGKGGLLRRPEQLPSPLSLGGGGACPKYDIYARSWRIYIEPVAATVAVVWPVAAVIENVCGLACGRCDG